jgi:RNA polymerase sigma factor for flagellar operon FliA
LTNYRQRRVPPCVTFDDLTSGGTVGLIEAVDRFDSSRDLKFRSYAQHRVMGAMLDFLRGEDPLSRGERRRVRDSASAVGAKGCGTKPMTVSLDHILLAHVSASTPADFAVRSEIREARQCLSPRENRVIVLLYVFGWQNREVAADLNVNESRVSQIKQRAISKLRLQLEPRSTPRAA